jgi:hypothetical protein
VEELVQHGGAPVVLKALLREHTGQLVCSHGTQADPASAQDGRNLG